MEKIHPFGTVATNYVVKGGNFCYVQVFICKGRGQLFESWEWSEIIPIYDEIYLTFVKCLCYAGLGNLKRKGSTSQYQLCYTSLATVWTIMVSLFWHIRVWSIMAEMGIQINGPAQPYAHEYVVNITRRN